MFAFRSVSSRFFWHSLFHFYLLVFLGFGYPVRGTPLPNEGRISGRVTPMAIEQPATRPANPRFSSGPCAKPPAFNLQGLSDAALGRSHRAAIGKEKLKVAIEGTREILGIPDDYRIGIVPASDTGAVEMAMWSLLGERKVEMLAWESFGKGWVTDVVKQLKLEDVHFIQFCSETRF